jgi:hypothetical protein
VKLLQSLAFLLAIEPTLHLFIVPKHGKTLQKIQQRVKITIPTGQ